MRNLYTYNKLLFGVCLLSDNVIGPYLFKNLLYNNCSFWPELKNINHEKMTLMVTKNMRCDTIELFSLGFSKC